MKQFLKVDWEAEKTGELLTNLGLEVEGIETFESVKGSLKGVVIGKVLTCATDMGITWLDGSIVSICTENLPEDIKIKGISCGFVMVSKTLEPGCKLLLKEGKRKIKATIVKDIRPDRTARKKLNNFI